MMNPNHTRLSQQVRDFTHYDRVIIFYFKKIYENIFLFQNLNQVNITLVNSSKKARAKVELKES